MDDDDSLFDGDEALFGMASTETIFSLVYFLFGLALIAPPTEFISAGLTVQGLLADYLGSEDLHFILYHIRRTTATAIFHSFLPLGKAHSHDLKLQKFLIFRLYIRQFSLVCQVYCCTTMQFFF